MLAIDGIARPGRLLARSRAPGRLAAKGNGLRFAASSSSCRLKAGFRARPWPGWSAAALLRGAGARRAIAT